MKLRNKLTTYALTTFAAISMTSVAKADLINGSFEDGTGNDAANWARFGNAYRENLNGNTGGFSMKMFGNFNGGTNVTGAFQDFAITAGQSATASVMGLNWSSDAMSGDNFALLKLIYRDAANNDLASQESARITRFTTADQYQLLTASMGAAPLGTDHGSVFLLFIQLDTTPFAGGAAWFDDASVRVVPEPSSILALGAGIAVLTKVRRRKA